jgi:hypothetical protein
MARAEAMSNPTGVQAPALRVYRGGAAIHPFLIEDRGLHGGWTWSPSLSLSLPLTQSCPPLCLAPRCATYALPLCVCLFSAFTEFVLFWGVLLGAYSGSRLGVCSVVVVAGFLERVSAEVHAAASER